MSGVRSHSSSSCPRQVSTVDWMIKANAQPTTAKVTGKLVYCPTSHPASVPTLA
jgi:hypothetical protein